MKKEKIKSILILSIVSILLIMLTGCGTTKKKMKRKNLITQVIMNNQMKQSKMKK